MGMGTRSRREQYREKHPTKGTDSLLRKKKIQGRFEKLGILSALVGGRAGGGPQRVPNGLGATGKGMGPEKRGKCNIAAKFKRT